MDFSSRPAAQQTQLHASTEFACKHATCKSKLRACKPATAAAAPHHPISSTLEASYLGAYRCPEAIFSRAEMR